MDISNFPNAVDLSDVPRDEWKKKYVGKGYRSSCYFVDSKQGYAILFGYDLKGNPKTFIFRHDSKVKYRVKYPTKESDIFGNYLETKFFKNIFDRRKWLETADGIHVAEAFRPEQEILLELFHENIFDEDYNTQPMRTFYLDIETEISDKFENPKDARNRINMITVYDSKKKKFITWSLQHADIDFKEDPLDKMPKESFEFREFRNNEFLLLENFIQWWETNYPDVVTAWNGKAYDYPYIVRRIENTMGEDWAKRLSPIHQYRIKEVNHDNKRAIVGADIEIELPGIFLADDLILYRDKFKVKQALDGGYGLDNVGEAEDLGHKIHYSGTLKDLYEQDYQKFYEYNVRDVDLLKKIEDQCKLIPLARRIVGTGLCNYDTIYSSISYLIGSLSVFARLNMDGKIFQSYLNQKKEKTSFEGAFVFPTRVGRYSHGIGVVDFSSLYPSTIRALNISPETYVGKIYRNNSVNPYDPIDLDEMDDKEFSFIPASGGKTKIISKEELLELCKTKCIFTRNNTLFLKHSIKRGIVSEWCTYFYNKRKETKKQMQELELLLASDKSIKGKQKKEIKARIENLNNTQYAIKIMINSIYGILGTTFSPIGNVDLAQTITRTGKFCNISSAKFVTKFLIEKFGEIDTKKMLSESEDKTTQIVSGDTDSGHYTTKIYIKR